MGRDQLKNFLLTLRRSGQKIVLAVIALLVLIVGYLGYSKNAHQNLPSPNQDIQLGSPVATPSPTPSPTPKPVTKTQSMNMADHQRSEMYRTSVHRRYYYAYSTHRHHGRYVSLRMQYRTGRGTTYVVRRHDSLWKIAQHHYHAGVVWPKIYTHNRATIGKNPNRIYPRMRLVLPRLARRSHVHKISVWR